MPSPSHLPDHHADGLLRLGELALEPLELPALLHQAAALVAGALSVDHCQILELLPDAKTLVQRAAVGWPEEWIGRAVIPAGAAQSTPEAMWLLHGDGVTCGVSLVIPGPVPCGVLAVHSRARRSFSPQDLHYLHLASELLGRAIQMHRAHPAAGQTGERFRQLFEDSTIGMALVGLDRRFLQANSPICELLGYSPEELRQLTCDHITHPGDLAAMRNLTSQLLSGGVPRFQLVQRGLARRGRTVWVRLTGALVRDHRGHPLHFLALVEDFTEGRRGEQYLRALVDNAMDLIAVIGADGTVLYVSASIERLLGFTPAERIGRPTYEIVHPDERPAVQKAIALGRAGPGAAVNLEVRLLHKDGAWRHFEVVARNLLEDGIVSGIVVNARDISERKRAEENLRASEEWFRTSFEHSAVASAIFSLEGRFLHANAALCRFLGRSAAELAELSWVDVAHPEDVKAGKGAIALLSSEQTPSVQLEKRCVHRDGRVLWGDVTLSLIRDAQGLPTRIVAQIIDVSGRNEALQSLRQSEQRFRLAAESASDLIYEWDVKTGRLEWFGAVDACLGYSPGRFPRTFDAWKSAIHPDDLGRVEEAIACVAAGSSEPPDVEYRIRTRKGGYRRWLGRGRCLRDQAGQVDKWVGACSDITARRKADEDLRRSQCELRALAARLISSEEEQLRSLARELHDDFSQRLTALSFELASLQAPYPPFALPQFQQRLAAAQERLATLSNDLRRLAHQLHPSAVELLGLPAALRELCHDASNQGRLAVTFRARKLPDPLPRDAALCLYRVGRECLRNILRHAGATTAAVTLSGLHRGLRLSIRDDGVGFDPAEHSSKGGLGLISMRERVRLAGGTFSIQSRPGHGTTVVAEVPAAGAGNQPAAT